MLLAECIVSSKFKARPPAGSAGLQPKIPPMVQPSHPEPGGDGVDWSRSARDADGQGKVQSQFRGQRVQGFL